MALGKKAYPKATVKKIIKAHSNHNLKKNADVTVGHRQLRSSRDRAMLMLTLQIFLDYVLFMESYDIPTTQLRANAS